MSVLDSQAAAYFDGIGDGNQIVGELVELLVPRPVIGAFPVAVGSGIADSLFAGEGDVVLGSVTGNGEEVVGAGSPKDGRKQRVADFDVAAFGCSGDGCGRDAICIIGRWSRAGIRLVLSRTVFADEENVTRGIELGMLEGEAN